MKFLPKIGCLCLGFIPIFSVCAFGDIAAEDPNAHVFQHLQDVKIMGAFEDGNFHPEKLVTRAEGLAIAMRAGGIAIPAFNGNAHFTDVDPNGWYSSFVARGIDLGFISVQHANFRPNEAITKAEFLAFLFRATNVKLDTLKGALFGIANDVQSDAWFAPHFAYAKKYQIATLPADNFYNPTKPLSRQEVALMTFRQLKIFHGDAVTKDLAELQGKIQQFVVLLRSGKPEQAELQLQGILALSEQLSLQRNNENAVAAYSISKAMKSLADSMRSFKFGDTLTALENLHLAAIFAERAKEKSENMAPFATELSMLIDETLSSFSNPRIDSIAGGIFAAPVITTLPATTPVTAPTTSAPATPAPASAATATPSTTTPKKSVTPATPLSAAPVVPMVDPRN